MTKTSAFSRGETHVQFYRKAAIDKIGLFDITLGPGTGLPYACGEDTDYLLRALDAGITVRRRMSIHTRHPAPSLDKLDTAKIRSYAIGRMHLLRKHHFNIAFKLANVLFPLLQMPVEGPSSVRYRLAMAQGRLQGLIADLKDVL